MVQAPKPQRLPVHHEDPIHGSSQKGTAPHLSHPHHDLDVHAAVVTEHYVSPHPPVIHEQRFHTTGVTHHPGPYHEAPLHKGEHGVSPHDWDAHSVPLHHGSKGLDQPSKEDIKRERTPLHPPGVIATHGVSFGVPVMPHEGKTPKSIDDHDIVSKEARKYFHHELPFKQPVHEEPLTEIIHHEKVHHMPWQKGVPKHEFAPALHHEKLPKEKMERHYRQYPDEHSYRRFPGEPEPEDIKEREVHEKHSAWTPAYAYTVAELEKKEKGQPLDFPKFTGGFKTAYGEEHGFYQHMSQTAPYHEHPGHGDYQQEHDVHDADHEHAEDWHVE